LIFVIGHKAVIGRKRSQLSCGSTSATHRIPMSGNRRWRRDVGPGNLAIHASASPSAGGDAPFDVGLTEDRGQPLVGA
jgi:hypothetical protein